MAKGNDIQDRLINFAVRVVKLCNELPDTIETLVHKLRVVLKELIESGVWLEIIIQSEMLPDSRMNAIIQECNELCKIISTSLKTIQSRLVR